jgi:hypothetical protein
VIPVPESETEVGELVALLTTEMLPVALPAAAGAKVALRAVLRPAVRMRGSESPLMLKPAPVTVACRTFTRRVPVFLRVMVLVRLLPTVTFPKPRLVGLALSFLLAAASLATKNTALKRKRGNRSLAPSLARRHLRRGATWYLGVVSSFG